jgi:lipopolysaccharide/colanic/teichoic acid biosynthesis glycosyltransferase
MLRRLVDIGVAILLLAPLAPVLAILALLIRRGSRGPALYVPAVVGQYGRLFPLLRFRTMRVDLVDDSADQRLTCVGRVLRNYSLDHLPMLFNVLIGDLTLVGPRPMERAVVDLRAPTWQAYVRTKPGLVNYAVLKLGRTWTRVRAQKPALNQELELLYAQQRTPLSDARLFTRMVWELLRSRGNVKARKPPDADVAP